MLFRRQLRVIGRRFRSLLKKETMDAELDSELAFHVGQLVREQIANGMPPEEARLAARRMFGNTAVLEEECRDHRRMGWLHDFCQDVRYGARMLRNSPTFTAVAIASLALGIGANTAILAAMARVLFDDFALPNENRIVVIQTFPLANPGQTHNASVPDYLVWRDRSRSFEAMGTSLANQADLGPGEDGASAEHVTGAVFTSSLFETLGVQPMLGRVFTEAETQPGKTAPVIVLSHRLWLRLFGGDPGIVGKSIRVDGRSRKVIGVMPPEFRYPDESAEYWAPLSINRFQLQPAERYFIVTARLKEGTTLRQAEMEMDVIAAQLSRDFPDRHGGFGVRVRPLRERWFGWTRAPLLTLEGSVILVMLIVCSNLATLLLARSDARRQEMAVRMALGAGRVRLVRQLLTESILLSLLGGTAGLLIAWLSLKVIPRINPPPGGLRLTQAGLNTTMLGVTMLCAILTGVIFGIVPAIRTFSPAQGMRGGAVSGTPERLRSTLLIVQIALALVLLAGSGLLVNSFIRMNVAPRNFDPDRILTFAFRIPLGAYLRGMGVHRSLRVMEVAPPTLAMQRIYERLRALPGVESIAGISVAPVNSLIVPAMNFAIEGRPEPQTDAQRSALSASYFVITPNLFATMKTPFVRGRDIDMRDTASSNWVAIINEAAARRFWPDEDAIGKRIILDAASGERPRQIIGVVRNVPLRYLSTVPAPVIYTSYLQQAERYRGPFANMFGQMVFLIRSTDDPLRLIGPVRTAAAEVDPERPLSNIQTMEQFVGAAIRDRGFYTLAFSVFAFAATLLAAIGVYGVTAYSVALRTREIGVRMALGAAVRDIAYLIGGRALLVIASGLVLGLAASVAFTRLIASQLWGVAPTDPLTFCGVSVLLTIVVLCACFIPARRAIRVNPAEALRGE